jgi:hypothetical protein
MGLKKRATRMERPLMRFNCPQCIESGVQPNLAIGINHNGNIQVWCDNCDCGLGDKFELVNPIQLQECQCEICKRKARSN